MPEHTKSVLHAGFQLHFLCLYSPSISLCAKWGHASCVGMEGEEGGGWRMLFVLKVSDDLNFRFTEEKDKFLQVVTVISCSHFMWPRSKKLEPSTTWLKFLTIHLFTQCLSAKQIEGSIMGTVMFHGFSELQVNEAELRRRILCFKTPTGNPTGQRPRIGAQDHENAPLPPSTASGWDK